MERQISMANKAPAGRVFLLMGKEYRISRSIRAQWFFQHLDKPVYPKPDTELAASGEELEVLSVIPEDPTLRCQDGDEEHYLVPSTKITFIGRQYRFVFCIDMSPSSATVDVDTGKVLIEEMYEDFSNCMHGLVEEFYVPGSNVCLQPDLFVTVLAHTTIPTKSCQVLVQGYCATKDNVNNLVNEVCGKLQTLEDFMAEELMKRFEQSLNSEAERGSTLKGGQYFNPEGGLFNMIRDGLLALQLLPDNASAGLIIITDGVFGFENASVVDAALAQMRANTVVCSFLQVGKGSQSTRHGFGYIAHSALMQFIATATSGAYVVSCDKIACRGERLIQDSEPGDSANTKEMNMYHKALYCWNFQRDADRDKVHANSAPTRNNLPRNSRSEFIRSTVDPCLSVGSRLLPLQPLQRIKHSGGNLNTRISSVLSVRLREGYSIDKVAITKDGRQLEVKLILPWKEHVLIEYTAKAKWASDQPDNQTHVEVHIGGSYDFLIDVTRKQRISSNYRKIVVQKFEQTVKELRVTDDLLVRLQSFALNPVFYTIPDSARKGVPLFYLPPGSGTPVLSLQHGKSRNSPVSQEAQFAVFWKPVLNLDTKVWQKWFHCHRISILMENDWPLSRKLFIPSGTDHYANIQCRVSGSVLNKFLKEWCSFVLLENYSYIKFLAKPQEKEPYSFCILRLVFKGLCVVLRLAFLGGTAGTERQKVVSSLRDDLCMLKVPTSKSMFSPDISPPDSPSKTVDNKAKARTGEKACLILLKKPLERVLVKHESIPFTTQYAKDPRIIETGSQKGSGLTSPAPDRRDQLLPKPSSALLSMLSSYMYNQRWTWSMSSDGIASLSQASIGNILFHLIQLRLYEGFHICNSTNGIITMIKEVHLLVRESSEISRESECLIQYVLFPPHQQGGPRLAQEDSAESDVSQDNDGVLQMVTEVWVEPQYGVVNEDEAALMYLNDAWYCDIPAKMFPWDLQLTKQLVTYTHLENMCNDKVLITAPETRGTITPPTSDFFVASSTHEIPFPFNIPSLLWKSKQVVEFYPLLKEKEEDAALQSGPNKLLLSFFHEALGNLNDCSARLSEEECHVVTSMATDRCRALIESYKTSDMVFIAPSEKDVAELVKWHCYVKDFSGSLIITVVPWSYEDLKRINLMNCTEYHAIAEAKQTDDTKVADEASDRVEERRHPVLPVLVYQCDYTSISAIPPTDQTFDDVIQDFTFTLSECFVAPSPDLRKSSSSKTIGSFGKSSHLLSYCNSLYDRYFLTFVNAVFAGLRKGFVLDNQDVESSVEMICEETYIEIDISGLAKMLCSHWQTKQEEEMYQSVFEESHCKISCRKGKRPSSGSTSTKSSKSSTTTTLSCKNEATQSFVKDRFKKYLHLCFTSVPKNDNILYYSIAWEKRRSDTDVQSEFGSDQENDTLQDLVEADATTIIEISKDYMNSSLQENLSELSRRSVKGTTNSDIDDMDNLSSDESEEDLEDEMKPMPLFLLLTCSVKDKSNLGTAVTSFPIDTLPTCLGDVIKNIEGTGTALNPRSPSLTVTLDLICLTLPQEADINNLMKQEERVPYLREGSHDSFMSSKSHQSEPEAVLQDFFALRKQQESSKTIFEGDEESSYIGTNIQMIDPLKYLPKYQQKAVKETVQKIEFLLEDEIASALRSVTPVTQVTLERVAKHIALANADNCRSECIPLKFVFGIEKSLKLFLDRLEELRLDSYCLKKEGQYYYVTYAETSIQSVDKLTESFTTTKASGSSQDSRKKISGTSDSFSGNTFSSPGTTDGKFSSSATDSHGYDHHETDIMPMENGIDHTDDGGKSQELLESDMQRSPGPANDRSIFEVDDHVVEKGTESEGNEKVSSVSDDANVNKSELKSAENGVAVVDNMLDKSSLNGDMPEADEEGPSGHDPLFQELAREGDQGDPPMKSTSPTHSSQHSIPQQTQLLSEDVTNQSISQPYENISTDEDFNVTAESFSGHHLVQDDIALGTRSLENRSSWCHRRQKSEPPLKFSEFDYQREISYDEEIQQVSIVEHSTDVDFWLFLRLENNGIIVFSHTRTMDSEEDDQRHEILYTKLVHTLEITCRIVNQIMLLDDLYDTMTCHNLLVAEEDEQIWAMNQENTSVKPIFVTTHKQDVEMGMPFELSSVVHGEFEFKPGHFECDCVWNIHLPVHFRLKSSPGQQKGTSRGIQAVRAVLNRFSVTNRSNLFVFRESSGKVFYFRIFESICVYDNVVPSTPNRPPVPDEDVVKEDNLSVHSQASSMWSLSVRGYHDMAEEPELSDAKLKRTSSFANTGDKDSLSELSLTGSSQTTEETIHFIVYGICDPGKEIKVDLIKVLQSRLDDSTLEQLNLLLARNPKCRLAPSDVHFIQPPGKPPNSVLFFKIATPTQLYTHPMMYYLRQNLLLKFHTPRFAETNSEFHFKNYGANTPFLTNVEAFPANDVYLYNKRGTKGIGIGCIHVSIVNGEEQDITTLPRYPCPKYDVSESDCLQSVLRDLLDLEQVEQPDQEENAVFLRFRVWGRGDIGIKDIEDCVSTAIRHSICDVFLEYFVLATSTGIVPQAQLVHSRVQSRSPSTGSQKSYGTYLKGVHSLGSCHNIQQPIATSNDQLQKTPKGLLSEPSTPASHLSRSPIFDKPVADLVYARVSGRCTPDEDVFDGTIVAGNDLPSQDQSSAQNSSPLSGNVLADNFPRDSPMHLSDTSPVLDHVPNRKSPLIEQVQTGYETTSRSGSPFDTLTDKEVEESLKAVSEQDVNVESRPKPDLKLTEKKESTWQEIEIQRRREAGRRKERRKYEVGELGELHPCFSIETKHLFEKVLSEQYTTVFKHEGRLNQFYSADVVLKEVIKILVDLCPDMKPKVFRKVNRSDEEFYESSLPAAKFAPFVDRTALKVEERGESTLDSMRQQLSFVPGQNSHYIVIGRNMSQWRSCVGILEEIADDDQENSKSTGEEHSKQKFKGLDPRGSGISLSKTPESYPPSSVQIAFVPRQKIFFVELIDRKVLAYAYNLSTDVTASLEMQLSRLIAWHNARGHLQSCLFMQKLGLFHHSNFVKGGQNDQDTHNFVNSTSHQHLVFLMKETTPPTRERSKAHENDPAKLVTTSQLPTFDDMFYDTSPPRLLHNAGYRFVKDVVKRSGHQYQEVRNVRLSVNLLNSKLHEVFDTWQQRGSHIPIYEDRLYLLRRQSRLVHFCITPFLFLKPKEVRENTLNRENVNSTEKGNNKERDGNVTTVARSTDSNQEWNHNDDVHDWAGELAWNFTQQYIKYLQTLGMCLIQPLPSSKRDGSGKVKTGTKRSLTAKAQETSKGSETGPGVLFLQKTSPGGIILLELEFKELAFSVKIYGLESVRVKPLAWSVSAQDTLIFLDDCAKFKDYAHLHSFSYDFHIRQIQQYLAGRHSILYPGYPINELLVLIQEEHPRPPHFSCCLLGEGTVSVPCTPGLSTSEVYHYLTLNCKRHDLSVVKGKKSSVDTFQASDTLLSYMYTTNRDHASVEIRKISSNWRDGYDFDGTVVVSHTATDDNEVIDVHFFLVLTSRREFYPRLTLFGQTSSLKRLRKRAVSGSESGSSVQLDEPGQTGYFKPRVRFTTTASSGSNDNLPEGEFANFIARVGSGPIRVPTWPGSFPKEIPNNLKPEETMPSCGSDSQLSSSQQSLSTTVTRTTSVRGSPVGSSLKRSESSDSEPSNGSTLSYERSYKKATIIENYLASDSKFIQEEISRVRGRIKDTVCSCLSNCWRDLIWYEILLGEIAEDESGNKKGKKKSDERRGSISSGIINGWELSKILSVIRLEDTKIASFSSMKMLLQLVNVVKIEDIDPTVKSAFSVLRSQQRRSVLRTVVSKFTPFVRTFVSDDLQTTYLCILNPYHYDMFVLLISDERALDICIVHRERPKFVFTENHSFDDIRTLDQADVRQVEEVLSCLCFTIWMQLIRT